MTLTFDLESQGHILLLMFTDMGVHIWFGDLSALTLTLDLLGQKLLPHKFWG